jgi:hypothetical protein
MPNVFISCSSSDVEFANKVADRLRADGIMVSMFTKIEAGENIQRRIEDFIASSDYSVVILSNRSVNSEWVNLEISATLIKEVSQQKNIILPILLEDCEIPFSLKDRLYADFRFSFEEGYAKLAAAIKEKKAKTFRIQSHREEKFKVNDYSPQLRKLKEEFRRGNLALFCGAGVSYDAKIPTWNILLKTLLKAAYSNNHEVPNIDAKLASLFEKRINVSPLILAQYLKLYLGTSFTPTVRDALYHESLTSCETIDAIVELSRPKRERKPLRAIISFNFDDLIEENMLKEKIEFKCIFSEGERHADNELPIYHPHGCLPRSVPLTDKHQIVFSEDAYHSQFMDAFSWSNLVQLNHLNNCTALFIGISLSDPNMRRLLDVSIRKNGKGEKNHYIIKKRYNFEELYPSGTPGTTSDERVIPVLENIEELDANNLGFNVIWINNYNELPKLLLELGR